MDNNPAKITSTCFIIISKFQLVWVPVQSLNQELFLNHKWSTNLGLTENNIYDHQFLAHTYLKR